MKSSIHVVHPLMFKANGNKAHIGPVDEFEERDRRIQQLITGALDKGISTFYYRSNPEESIQGLMEDTILFADPLYSWIVDERLIPLVITDRGIPLPDERPERVPIDSWVRLSSIYTRAVDYKKAVGGFDNAFFIGGMLEACLANAMVYYDLRCRQSHENMYCIEDLSVFVEEENARVMKRDILKGGIVKFVKSGEVESLLEAA